MIAACEAGLSEARAGGGAGSQPAQESSAPVLVAQLGHLEIPGIPRLCALAVTGGGRLALTASDQDPSMILWDALSGKEIRRFRVNCEGISAASLSADGRYVFALASDGACYLWDGNSGSELRKLKPALAGPEPRVAAMSPDGRSFLTDGPGGAVLRSLPDGKEIRRFKGATEGIRVAAFSPDGNLVAGGGPNGVALWDANAGTQLRQFAGPSSMLALSRDNRRLLTGDGYTVTVFDTGSGNELGRFQAARAVFSEDGESVITLTLERSIRLWEIATGKELQRWAGELGNMSNIVFAPDGRSALAIGEGKAAGLWRVEAGQEQRLVVGIDSARCITTSPDGRLALLSLKDGSARLYEVATGREVRRFEGDGDAAVTATAFSSDGRLALTCFFGGRAVLWQVATGRKVQSFLDPEHKSLGSVAFSRDGKSVLTAGEVATLWDVSTGKPLRTFGGISVKRALFSPTGRRVIGSGYGDTLLWDSESADLVLRLRGKFAAIAPDESMVWTYDWKLGAVRAWNKNGSEVSRFGTHSSYVSELASSVDGRSLLTAGEDQIVRVWRIGGAKETSRHEVYCDGGFRYPGSIALIGNGSSLLAFSVSWHAPRATSWELASGRQLTRFEGASSWHNSVAFSRDGRSLLVGLQDGATLLWRIADGGGVIRFFGEGEPVERVAFSPDNGMAFAQDSEGTFRCWKASGGAEFQRPTAHSVLSSDGRWTLTLDRDDVLIREAVGGKEILRLRDCARFGLETRADSANVFSNDALLLVQFHLGVAILRKNSGEALVIRDLSTFVRLGKLRPVGDWIWSAALAPNGSSYLLGLDSGSALQIETVTGKVIREFKGGWGPVCSVAFSPDGRLVLTDGVPTDPRWITSAEAILWDAATGKELRRFAGHGAAVASSVFSPDGRFVLTGSRDGTARLWDTNTARCLCTLTCFRDGTWAVVDPDGRYDASHGGDVEGLHWVVGNEPIALRQLKERYWDPGLLAKIMGFKKEPLKDVRAFRDVRLFPDLACEPPAKGGTRLALKLTNRGGGIGKVQVFVNDKELMADARGVNPDADVHQATLTVDLADAPVLPGKPNRIRVVAYNAEGSLSSRGLEMLWTPEGELGDERPELYAIVGGVSTYASPALALRFAAKDADDMARALEVGAGRLFGVERVHLTLLSTSGNPRAVPPTKDNFRAAFKAAGKAKPHDLLVVYLAGHGVSLQRGSDLYCYLTQEARTTDSAVLASDRAILGQYAITSDEMAEWIKQIKALKQVMVLDTCAAGAASARLAALREISGDQIRAMERLKDRTGFHVLMGCAADRASYETTQYEQGLLTHALLQGMRGAALRDDRYVDVSRLFQFAADRVPELARGIGGVQKPLVAAPRGTSFDVGLLTSDDKRAIPLALARPMVLRPLLFNPDEDDDNLHLSAAVRNRLGEESYAAARGPGRRPGSVFVDAEELPGAIRPTGSYRKDGETVKVRLILKRDGQKVGEIRVDGPAGDIEGLTAKIAEAIARELEANYRP
jgi:WD40 repeat protein